MSGFPRRMAWLNTIWVCYDPARVVTLPRPGAGIARRDLCGVTGNGISTVTLGVNHGS